MNKVDDLKLAERKAVWNAIDYQLSNDKSLDNAPEFKSFLMELKRKFYLEIESMKLNSKRFDKEIKEPIIKSIKEKEE